MKRQGNNLGPVGMAVLLHVVIFASMIVAFDYSRPAIFTPLAISATLVQKVLDFAGLGGFVDRSLMERIGSTISDYLVAFGVASISIRVVIDHTVPLLLMSALGIAYSVGLLRIVGPRMFRDFWFEKGLFVYGWNTGTVGIGIALLRVVDPRQRSRALADFGLAYLGISFAAIAIIVALPQLVVRGYTTYSAAALAAGFLVCLALSRSLLGWRSGPLR